MTVVAEGVEDETQVAWLHAQRCDMIQGDLVGRPVPADAFLSSVTLNRGLARFGEAARVPERRAA
jgi:EAL domain-containing protein (putative c-di-GMP-specific phosphodiesterase class I)